MPALGYKALDARGKQVSGVRNVESPRALRALLKKEGVYVTDVYEASDKTAASGKGLTREVGFKTWFDRVRLQDVAAMTRQLATLLRAGIPLAESLQALMEQATSEKFATALADIRTKVNEGRALADSLAEHPGMFSDLYVNMVRAGETSGNLDSVLVRLADVLDAQLRLRNKVSGAMTYPAVMAVVGVLVMSVLMGVVVPKITQIFEDIGETLPWYTRLLIGISHAFSNYWWLIGALVAGAIYGFRRWRRTETGKARWDAFVLRLWIVGGLVRMVAIARFSRTLGTMLSSGVPLLQALDIVKAILGNHVLVSIVDKSRTAIREGESIAEPLARSGEFPPVVTRMIAVGERSGALESMLDNIADAYERDIEIRLGRLTSLMEPLMIVVMGGVVGFIVFSILMPILRMNEVIG